MIRALNRWRMGPLLACIVLISTTHNACAAGYSISWGGTLESTGQNDPWGLGGLVAPFHIKVDLSPTLVDIASNDIEEAYFNVSSVWLVVAEREGELRSDAVIGFDDLRVFNADGSPVPDIVSLYGVFAFDGMEATFQSVFGLPADTFMLSGLVEPPPIFQSTFVTGPGTAFAAEYRSDVSLGTPVKIVPEPAAGVAALASILAATLFSALTLTPAPTGSRLKRGRLID